MKNKVEERVESLALKEIRLGLYICPKTGLYHVCKDDLWVNSEDEEILDVSFYPYGFEIVKEKESLLFLDTGGVLETTDSSLTKYGSFTNAGEKEKFVFLPSGRILSKDGQSEFESLMPSMWGILVYDEDFEYFYSMYKKGWLEFKGKKDFDEIFDMDEALICRRGEKWSVYFVGGDFWWEAPSGENEFENIDLIQESNFKGLRVKSSDEYKFYPF